MFAVDLLEKYKNNNTAEFDYCGMKIKMYKFNSMWHSAIHFEAIIDGEFYWAECGNCDTNVVFHGCDVSIDFDALDYDKPDLTIGKACSCGHEKLNLPGHSDWCEKYKDL